MKKSEKKLFFSLTYEFLEVYMRIQMLRSPATIESYRDALTVFRRYLRDELHIGKEQRRDKLCALQFIH